MLSTHNMLTFGNATAMYISLVSNLWYTCTCMFCLSIPLCHQAIFSKDWFNFGWSTWPSMFTVYMCMDNNTLYIYIAWVWGLGDAYMYMYSLGMRLRDISVHVWSRLIPVSFTNHCENIAFRKCQLVCLCAGHLTRDQWECWLAWSNNDMYTVWLGVEHVFFHSIMHMPMQI